MKKYLLGLFAISLAFGFSAFTTSKPVKKAGEMHWYRFNSSTNTLTVALGFIERAYAIDEVICPDDGTIVCSKGYDTDYDYLVGVTGEAPGGEGDFIVKVE